MHITDRFDSGNIVVVAADDPKNIRLRIRADEGKDGFFQWFHFRVTDNERQPRCLVIENAGQASYLKGWDGYKACASYDRETWFRVETTYKDGCLSINHTPEFDSTYYAYFAPFTRERHHSLIAHCQQDSRVQVQVLGETVDGDAIDLLTIGDPKTARLKLWAIARQHPGETQAEFWMEGFLSRLLESDDATAKALLSDAVFYVVPNMNPDGSRRGHLRTNAAGVNLNRAWADPDPETSPEVFHVDRAMREIGVDFCIDVHGDEGLPYNFIAGADAIPNAEPRLIQLREAFEKALRDANPDFQSKVGYPKAAPGKANMTIATAHIAALHKCLSMTLEMPFKDNADAPDPEFGWSPNRCRKLGASCLDALYAISSDLR